MNKNYCIYKHQCKDNGQIYIGQTCQNVNRRWRDGEGYKGSPYFYAAICVYG
jgi:predicted GIY-YIG superfamily endonuclease